jgi:endonuclease-3
MSLPFRFAPYGRQMLRDLDLVLDDAYGAPEALLGNQDDPLDEAVYIILSFQTDLPRFKETWQSLRTAFPRWQDVEAASSDEVASALRVGGLHRQKAKAIKRLLRTVRRQFGTLSLDSLREMGNIDAERVLTRLPGISWKGARCVLLYSLDRPVFPVDGNTFRILQRTGVIPLSAVYRRLSLHDALQSAIEPDRRRRFHVNLVLHGQEVCLPQRPRCTTCPAANVCRRRGLPHYSVDDQATSATEQERARLSPKVPSSQRAGRRELTVHHTAFAG